MDVRGLRACLPWIELFMKDSSETNSEEARARDVETLKEALEEMKLKLEESNAMVIREREAAQKAILEGPQVVKETTVLVQDTEKIDSLTAEIEKLKDQLEKEKKSTGAALQTCAELHDKNEKLVKQLKDAGKKVEELQESIQRFEEKLSNLEAENQVLRQQALSLTSVSMNLAQELQPQPQLQMQPRHQPETVPQDQPIVVQDAKEKGAFKEVKERLEKCVTELRLRLQLEKRQRIDLEEAQAQDVAKLKEALDEMKLKLEESNAMVIKEREAAQMTIEEVPPVVKETPVFVQDTEKIDSLTVEIENLKDQLEKEKNSTSAALQTCAELQDKKKELVKQLEWFEEKLTNLEAENHVLCQQAMKESGALKEAKDKLQKRVEDEELTWTSQLKKRQRIDLEEAQARDVAKLKEDLDKMKLKLEESNAMVIKEREVAQKAIQEAHPVVKEQENEDILISCISKDIGFSNGRPVAACVIYNCLLHWGSFEVERTSIFDHIIQEMTSSLGATSLFTITFAKAQDSTDLQFYWLSNSAMLLLLLQRTLKASSAAHAAFHRRRTSTLFGRASKGIQPSQICGTGGVRQVEAKYPALLFKQQLTGFLGKIYETVRDRMKKEISALLGSCIQAPRTARAALAKGVRSQHHHPTQQALVSNWQSIVKILDNYLQKMRDNYVPPFIVREIFKQIFLFINIQLYNSLLLRRECCSFSNGEYVKAGLSEIESWCSDATDVYTGAAWDELKHIRQAVAFLVTEQKPKKTLKEITEEICPGLSIQQLYRISSMYWDDKYGTHTISNEVMRTMKAVVVEDSNPETSSFLLDDDSIIPFSIDDMSRAMELEPIDITDIEPPPFLVRQNSGFAFLV